MKNGIIGFFIGIIVLISLAATPIGQDIITFKPATPKEQQIIISGLNGLSDPTDEVKSLMRKGFVVTSQAASENIISIVMEKY